MPNIDDINSLANIPNLEAEFNFIDARLAKIQETIKSFDSNTLFSKGLNVGNVKTAADGFTETVKKSKTAIDDLAKANERLNKSLDPQAQKIAEVNAQAAANNKTIKEAAQAAIQQTDAYKTLVQQYNTAKAEALALGAAQGKSSQEFITAQQRAKGLADQIKELNHLVGDDTKNVGNYKESFSLLEQELLKVTSQLDKAKQGVQDFNNRTRAGFQVGGQTGGTTAQAGFSIGDQNQEVAKLTQQQQALQVIVDRTKQGFNSLTLELRQNERALQTMRAAGLADTEAFKALQRQTDESRRSFNEFAAQQKILSAEAPALKGLTVAAKGLGGAYAASAASAALFGDENGKIEKETAKLIAIMTLLQGLNEIDELLKTRSAIATAVAAAATRAYAIATGEATGAMRIFNLALTGTVIGAFIFALVETIQFLKNLAKEVNPVVKEIDNLTTATNESKVALKAYGKTAEEIADGLKKDLASGIKELNDQLGKTPTTVQNSMVFLEALQNRITSLKKENAELAKTAAFDEINAANIKFNNEELEKLEKTMREVNVQMSVAIKLQSQLDRSDFRKAVAQTFLQAIKDGQDANSRIIADARSTYGQRSTALAEFYKLENVITNKQREIEIDEAKDNQAKIALADSKFRSTQLKNAADFSDKQRDLDRQNEEDNRGATTNIKQRALQDTINRNKKIADDEQQTADIRVLAQRKFFLAEENLFAEQEKQEIHQVEITGNNEKKKQDIHDKFDELRFNAARENGEKLFALQVSIQKHELTLLETEQALFAKSATELNQIQYRELTAVSKDIDNKNQNKFVDIINGGIKTANDNLTKLAFTGDRFGKILSNLIPIQAGEDVDEYVKKIQALEKAITALGKEAVGAVFDIFTNKITNQKNAIQDNIDRLDVQKAKDIEVADQTISDEKDKAAAIADINAKADAQKALLQKKQRDLDVRKAQFDKAQAIAAIILNTAQSVTAALTSKPPNVILAGIVGAIGLVQAARAAAAPIPRYKYGTGSTPHPGGLGLLGDGYRAEGILLPDGSLHKSASVPTVYDLPEGAEVLPDFNRIVMKDLMYVNEHGKLVDNTEKAINRMSRSVVKALKEKQTNYFFGMPRHKQLMQFGNSFKHYVDQHV
jgi:hypothetical protein